MGVKTFLEEFNSSSNSKQVILLYDFLIDTIVKNGFRDSKDSVGKDITEIVTCLRLEITPRTSGTQGHDGIDEKTNRKQEIKTAENNIKSRTNFNFRLPKKVTEKSLKKSEACWLIYQSETKKYEDVILSFKDYLTVKFDGVFIAAVLSENFSRNGSLAINLGGKYCTKCKNIHKLVQLQELEKRFLKKYSKTIYTEELWFTAVTDEELWEQQESLIKHCKSLLSFPLFGEFFNFGVHLPKFIFSIFEFLFNHLPCILGV